MLIDAAVPTEMGRDTLGGDLHQIGQSFGLVERPLQLRRQIVDIAGPEIKTVRGEAKSVLLFTGKKEEAIRKGRIGPMEQS